MTRSAALKERFFDRGVAAFQRVTGDRGSLYYCPICEEPFGQAALQSNDLTLEHVPPKSLGGRPIALTCRNCNSQRGHRLDAAVRDRTTLFDLNEALATGKGHARGRARLQFKGRRVNVTYELRDRELTIVPPPGINSPEERREFLEHFQVKIHESIQFTPRIRFHPRRSKVGDLRTGYLAAFAKFGYSYAFNRCLSLVRQQISEPDRKVYPEWWILPDRQAVDAPLLVMLDQPVAALAVHLRTAIVLLPWPGDCQQFLQALAAGRLAGGDNRISMHGRPIEWPRTLELNLDVAAGESPD